MAQLRPYQALLQQHQVEVAVVTFERPMVAERYVADTQLPWPLLLDPQRSLYHAYGLPRATWRTLLSWRVLRRYFALMARGRMPHLNTDDVHQLGGDVLIDPAGIVRSHHMSTDPADRPEIAQLLRPVCGSPGPAPAK